MEEKRVIRTPFCEKGCLDTTKQSVDADPQGKQKADSNLVHASHQVENISSTDQKIYRNENLVDQRVDSQYDMTGRSVAVLHELQEGVCIWRLSLEFNGEDGECEDWD